MRLEGTIQFFGADHALMKEIKYFTFLGRGSSIRMFLMENENCHYYHIIPKCDKDKILPKSRTVMVKQEVEKPKFQRPPAVYNNHRPYDY